MQSGTVSGASISFTAHSSNTLAQVAARVVKELRHENGDDYDDIFNYNDSDYDTSEFTVPANENLKDEKGCDHDDDDEFEFAVVCSDFDSALTPAGHFFSQGHMLPRYPLFDRSLLLDVDPDLIKVVNGTAENNCKPSSVVVRLPLRKLLNEERDFTSSSSSSSEADDLDGVAPGTYCVWKPETGSPGNCKKSNFAGNSSRRWKFRDILYRSSSDIKESPFLLSKPLIATNKKMNNEKVKVEKSAKVAATVGDSASVVAPTEKNRANKAENRINRRR